MKGNETIGKREKNGKHKQIVLNNEKEIQSPRVEHGSSTWEAHRLPLSKVS
jgi:hypothetical protein